MGTRDPDLPEGFDNWKDVALVERVRRQTAENLLDYIEREWFYESRGEWAYSFREDTGHPGTSLRDAIQQDITRRQK